MHYSTAGGCVGKFERRLMNHSFVLLSEVQVSFVCLCCPMIGFWTFIVLML